MRQLIGSFQHVMLERPTFCNRMFLLPLSKSIAENFLNMPAFTLLVKSRNGTRKWARPWCRGFDTRLESLNNGGNEHVNAVAVRVLWLPL